MQVVATSEARTVHWRVGGCGHRFTPAVCAPAYCLPLDYRLSEPKTNASACEAHARYIAPGHSTIHLLLLQLYERSSLVPRLPLLFILWFAFSIIHRSRIILNTNWRAKNGGDLGTRLREIKIEQWENMGTRLRWQVASSPLSIYSVFFFFLTIYNRVNSWTWCTTVKLWLNCMCWSVSCNR